MFLKLPQLVVKGTVLKICVCLHMLVNLNICIFKGDETRLNLSISFLKIDPPLTPRTWGIWRWSGTSLTPQSQVFLIFSLSIFLVIKNAASLWSAFSCLELNSDETLSPSRSQGPPSVRGKAACDGWRKQGGRGRTTLKSLKSKNVASLLY